MHRFIVVFAVLFTTVIAGCGSSTPSSHSVVSAPQAKALKKVNNSVNAQYVAQCKKIGHTKQSDIDTCVEGYTELMNMEPPSKKELANADEYERSCLELGSRGDEVKECADALRALANGEVK